MSRLWEGVFENDPDSNCFNSMFWDCVLAGDVIQMMPWVAETQHHIKKFGLLKWSSMHTIAYAAHLSFFTENVTPTHLVELKQIFGEHQEDLMKFSSGGSLAIHLACQMNNSLILKIILEVANEKFSQEQFTQMLNQLQKDKYWQYTPLMIAIKYDSIDCIKILCQYDCIVSGILNIKSRYPNYNALEFACYYNNIDILEILINSCDLKQLNSNSSEYLQHLIGITNYGSSKRCLESECVEFLNDLSDKNNNHDDSKQLEPLVNETTTSINDSQEKNILGSVCCHNHPLLFAQIDSSPQKCDICQENSIRCGSCSDCASKADHKLFPSVICETCVKATSIWSTIVHTNKNTHVNNETISSLFNPDIINQVAFHL